MSAPVVVLDPAEMAIATLVASIRQAQNLSLGRRDAFGASFAPGDGLRLHLEGAAGELAVAKFLGRYWNGSLGQMRAGDVGQVQVRTTKHQNGCLILHPSDRDDDVFILAIGEAPTLRLAGWIRGRDGKQEKFRRDPVGGRAAFFVPQGALRPIGGRLHSGEGRG